MADSCHCERRLAAEIKLEALLTIVVAFQLLVGDQPARPSEYMKKKGLALDFLFGETRVANVSKLIVY